VDTCCEECAPAAAANPDERWLRNARYARWLAWASLGWMAAEGILGLVAGLAAGSIALVGWALGSGIEALASVIVVWRFTGSRTLSETAERQAQKAVAVSFWLLAPLHRNRSHPRPGRASPGRHRPVTRQGISRARCSGETRYRRAGRVSASPAGTAILASPCPVERVRNPEGGQHDHDRYHHPPV
jgi:hypothetical protein